MNCFCDDGWVCEQHPNRPWPHDDCSGPRMLCRNPACVIGLITRAELDARRTGQAIHDVLDETHFAGVGYEVPCPKCGHRMLESFARMPRPADGIVLVECPVHGLFHFRPLGPETRIVSGEPPEG